MSKSIERIKNEIILSAIDGAELNTGEFEVLMREVFLRYANVYRDKVFAECPKGEVPDARDWDQKVKSILDNAYGYWL